MSFISSLQAGLLIKPVIKILRKRTDVPSFWTMPHDPICREILANGFYERELLKGMCELGAPRSGAVIDVGANIGNHTIYFSREFSRVIAFEPFQPNCWILKANLHLNKISNVVLFEKAIGDVAGYARLAIDNPHDTNNGLMNETFEPTRTDSNAVEIVVGDEVIEHMKLDCPVGLVKIDVEGNEAKVVKGLERTIRRYRPFVCWEAFTLDKVNESRELLREMGYEHFYHITARKSPSRLMNKFLRLFDKSAALKPLDECVSFEGMNLASPYPLKL